MKDYKQPTRKPDLLDELNALRRRRGIAYRAGDIEKLELVHLEMKAFWLRNGWSEMEANEEYQRHVSECNSTFILPVGHSSITYNIFNRSIKRHLFKLTISELSFLWLQEKHFTERQSF